MVVNDLTGAVAKSEESFAIQALERLALEERDLMPWTCPIDAEVTFTYAIPDGWPAWKKAAALDGTWLHEAAPDLDNVMKLVGDAMGGVLFADDKQIRQVLLVKDYGPEDRVTVTLTPRVQAVVPAKKSKP
jgi:Holliday junction resolvase RusA-like endonuclease